ncbi:permease [Deferribacter abyssi]|uniref:permease n=1 Tax=Deferribacter abyssi TaxID=213806 RepID=UPI003C25298A
MKKTFMKTKGSNKMFIPTLIMAILAVALFIIAYNKGDNSYINGLKTSYNLFINILPILFFAIIVAGFIQILMPKELILKFIGKEAGLKGIFLGAIAGALTPGGPYVSFPLAIALLKSGAGIGTMVSFVTAWSIWGIARIPLEIGILGLKFTLLRLSSTFFFPILAGVIASIIAKILKI